MNIRVTRYVVSPKVKLFRYDVIVYDNPRPMTGTQEAIEFVRCMSRNLAQFYVNSYRNMYNLTSKNVEWRNAE
jgi:hypothetical protein